MPNFEDTINFLGFVIEKSRILPSKKKTKAIEHFPIMGSIKELQRFVGLTLFVRRYIRDYESSSEKAMSQTEF